MSSSLKERIIIALLMGVLCFMSLCVAYKLLFYREDWLLCSLISAISYSIGYFLSETIAQEIVDASMKDVIHIEILIASVVTVVISFITGIILNLSDWYSIVLDTCIPFILSLLINNKYD